MSVYKYCESCESSMDVPNATDCIIGTQLCSACEEPHEMDEFTRRWRINELLKDLQQQEIEQ
jgi:hypothetical protein